MFQNQYLFVATLKIINEINYLIKLLAKNLKFKAECYCNFNGKWRILHPRLKTFQLLI